MLVVLAVAIGWIGWVSAGGAPWINLTAMWPGAVLDGQVWRLFTWPFANALGLWPLLGLFFFWYFGTDLEQQIGKHRMAQLLLGIWGSLTVLTLALGALLPLGSSALAGISQAAQAEAERYGDVELSVAEGTNDVSTQISQVETFINEGVDAIVLLPFDGAALTPVALRAMEAGIPVINVDREFNSPFAARATVLGDNYGMGVSAGTYIC